MVRVAATGVWLYDGDVRKPVRVVESDRDFWFDLGKANGDLAADEQPILNADGLTYYVLFRDDWEPGQSFWPDSVGFMTAEDARRSAEERVSSHIQWDPR